MIYYYKLDKTSRIEVFTINKSPILEIQNSMSEIELPDNTTINPYEYTVIDGKLVYLGPTNSMIVEQSLFERQNRIMELKQFLQDTDYKIIKCYEASLLNKELPYDIIALTNERDSWRTEIEILETTQ